MSIKSRPLYAAIKRKLICHPPPPGEPLNVCALQNEYLKSSIPLREVLIELSKEDIIDFVPGRGFFVKNHNADELLNCYDMLEYLILDAAKYTLQKYPRAPAKPVIGPYLDNMLEKLSSPELNSYDQISILTDFLSHTYRRPQVDFIGMLLSRCHMEACRKLEFQGNRSSVPRLVSFYFRCLQRNKIGLLQRGLQYLFSNLRDGNRVYREAS